MAAILLLHSVRGLRDVERAAAHRLRSAGHDVTTPDLYAGERAATIEEGFAIKDRLGWEEICGRAEVAAAGLPAGAVLAGLSMGAGVAAELWARRPATAGLLLLHGIYPIPAAPRQGLPVQVHLAQPDEFEDEDEIAAWQDAAARAGLASELFRYPGAGHLFTDAAIADHDADAAALLWQRATAFLGAL